MRASLEPMCVPNDARAKRDARRRAGQPSPCTILTRLASFAASIRTAPSWERFRVVIGADDAQRRESSTLHTLAG
jgi:hypothetical protein